MQSLFWFTYFSTTVFVIGIIVRVVKVASMPMHLRWELYPVAHEGKRSLYGGSYLEDFEWWTKKREFSLIGELVVMLKEIFFLKALWDDNRKLWFPSLCLHHGVYWSALIAFLMFVNLFLNLDFVLLIIKVAVGIASATGIIGAISLLMMRMFDDGLRKYSTFATYFNLIFLLGIFGTGAYSFITNPMHFTEMTQFFQGLISGGSEAVLSAAVSAHILISILFVLYLPFTHMTHFVIKYFTYHSIRWNDEPNLPGGKMEKRIGALLKQQVTWSAKHIGADGKKNWVDIVTSEVQKNE